MDHAYGSHLLNELHASFSRDDQYSTPTGMVNPILPTVLLEPVGGEDDTAAAVTFSSAMLVSPEDAPTKRSGKSPTT